MNKKIVNGTASPNRTSKRNTSTVDLDSTDKAARLKAKKNLESVIEKGNSQQPLPFVTRDDSSLIASTKSLGLLLGNNVHSASDALKLLKIRIFRDLLIVLN